MTPRDDQLRADLHLFLAAYRALIEAHALGDGQRLEQATKDARIGGRVVLRRLLRRDPTEEELDAALRLDRPMTWPRTP